MDTQDLNGSGCWSASAIRRRYRKYAKQFGVSPIRKIEVNTFEERGERWVYPAMDSVIRGIDQSDLACAQIGIEFIEEDRGFPFGAILKSNTARSLRRCPSLTDKQMKRIRVRVVGMFLTGIVPREYWQYSRLLRKVGIGPYWPDIAAASPKNRHAERAYHYFMNHCAPSDGRVT